MKRSLTRELCDFVTSLQKEGADLTHISKAAFSKARQKLKYTAFVELNKTFVSSHYKSCEKIWVWKKFRLLAADGSTVEVPNSAEIKKEWGIFKERVDGKSICMARILQVYDVLNRLIVGGEIDSIKESETALLWKQLPLVKPIEGHDDLWLFDRYFASHLLIFYLNSVNARFCFRMKKDWWKICESFLKSGNNSQVITLTLPKKDKEKADELGIINRTITVRLARIELESGETEILLTSLCDEVEVSVADLKELYGYRWPIETNYRMLKHKVEIENFSGKNIKAVKQDYFAKILILNFASALVNPIDEMLKEKTKTKHVHQTNFTNAVGKLKTAVVDWFIHMNIEGSLKKIIHYLFKTPEIVRKGRKFKRPKLPKRKYPMNYKPV